MPGKEAKEPETAATFDEDEYKSNLIDKEGYSVETATMLAAKKKEKLTEAPPSSPTVKIEIDISKL